MFREVEEMADQNLRRRHPDEKGDPDSEVSQTGDLKQIHNSLCGNSQFTIHSLLNCYGY